MIEATRQPVQNLYLIIGICLIQGRSLCASSYRKIVAWN